MRVFTLIAALAFVLMVPGSAWSADLLYASGGSGFSLGVYFGQVVSYDVSIGSAPAIQNSANKLSGPNLYWPMGVTFDASGNFYVADYSPSSGTSKVYKIDSNGIPSTFVSPSPDDPRGIAVDSLGNLYVASSSGFIRKYNSSGVFVSNIAVSGAWGIAFDLSGNLYAAIPGINSVYKFDPSGALVLSISSNLSSPIDVAFDTSGNLYVTNNSGKSITKYDSSGLFLTSIPFDGGGGPTGIAFDSSGNFYVSNGTTVAGNGGKIYKYNSSGVFQFSWDAGIPTGIPTGPRFLAIQRVPEPPTYILGALASLTLAILARRQRGTALA